MSTPNHDTELEEILKQLRIGIHQSSKVPYNTEDSVAQHAFDQAKAALHTYLYKQMLELIGPDINVSHTTHDACPTCMRAVVQNQLKAQLRKAAAERWGQE